jgi:hypothetical protein
VTIRVSESFSRRATSYHLARAPEVIAGRGIGERDHLGLGHRQHLDREVEAVEHRADALLLAVERAGHAAGLACVVHARELSSTASIHWVWSAPAGERKDRAVADPARSRRAVEDAMGVDDQAGQRVATFSAAPEAVKRGLRRRRRRGSADHDDNDEAAALDLGLIGWPSGRVLPMLAHTTLTTLLLR